MQANILPDAARKRSKHLALEMWRSLAQALFLEGFLYFLFVGVSVACERPDFGLSLR